jgi:hypothetical protein
MSTHRPHNAAAPTSGGLPTQPTPPTQQTPDLLARAGAFPRAPLLLRVDGGFEALLGVLLLLSPATGLYSALDLPHPATQPVVVIVGLLLVPLLPALWLASRAPRRPMMLVLAGANGAGALVLLLWVLIWHVAFHPVGAAFVAVVAGILAVLAMLQTRAAFGAV